MSHSHSKSDNAGLFMGVAALAAGVGAVTAILFTPQRGADIKNSLWQKMRSMKSKAKQTSDEVDEVIDNAEDVALKSKADINDDLSKKFSEK